MNGKDSIEGVENRNAFGARPDEYDPDLYVKEGIDRYSGFLNEVQELNEDGDDDHPDISLDKDEMTYKDEWNLDQNETKSTRKRAPLSESAKFETHPISIPSVVTQQTRADTLTAAPPRKRRRWDVKRVEVDSKDAVDVQSSVETSLQNEVQSSRGLELQSEQQESVGAVQMRQRIEDDEEKNSVNEALIKANKGWDNENAGSAQAGTNRRASRWDRTPLLDSSSKSRWDGSATPAAVAAGLVKPEEYHRMRHSAEIEERNRPWTEAELDLLLPGADQGYAILKPPESYVPLRNLSATLPQASPTADSFYALPASSPGAVELRGKAAAFGLAELSGELSGIPLKAEDYQLFVKLLNAVDESQLTPEEIKERRILSLLLRIKNGIPSVRKAALRRLTDRAREFGASAVFGTILPLLMSPTLEDHERHLLVKVVDRMLTRLGEMVRPYVHQILVVIEPLLVDEDYFARAEGRGIIASLSKAAGLASMLSTIRPDIDSTDDMVRNTTARTLAVVGSALGVPSLIPFINAVIRSQKSWYARHTGVKIVQHLALLLGAGVLPHLTSLVALVEPALKDDQPKVRTVCALALAALAEASAPYGIESFETVLQPLWSTIRQVRGKTLAAFLKAVGFVIVLMHPEYASYYTRELLPVLIREFETPDEEMKKIVLRVIRQTCSCEGASSEFLRDELVPPFFQSFWIRKMSLDRRNYRALVETTQELALRVGTKEILERIVGILKDESEPFRRMAVETVDKVVCDLGLSEVDLRLEQRLMDGLLYAFQEQTYGSSNAFDAQIPLRALSSFLTKLEKRAAPYLKQIASSVKWRLNNQNPKIRQAAADLGARLAYSLNECDEKELLSHFSTVFYELLGEEFPDVLGSVLGALYAILSVNGIEEMNPSVAELLPRLTPILKNRHEKVQENCIQLVGKIAQRGADLISSREWMRICFELLELLKATKKSIRRVAVSAFGFLAKAIGANDVLITLLNNLKVQERTQRICTTVAIAIVAETCQPYMVLPALMNEYRIPELNVQNGVLKSLSFLFEYIGPMTKDYVYAVTPLLEDALIDRDLVHRQTACSAVAHLALGLRGHGKEDALLHLLNHVWPNIFETSPHVINAVFFAIEALGVALGPSVVLLYLLQGLFHPARSVREVYWRIHNALYVSASHALIPAYPRIIDDSATEQNRSSRFIREELDLVL
uniref:Splicing factor 3B subunit 1 domain-containing protein n=1 Tax=Timspurckia oligopyrenoides TaxID=708627 RepID=A0A7S0ZCN9_9RHOD|mmetsp:Transcript_12695/g.22832  ORF Transcript_12695/g.22832 Transcript_12695/m.22832 type:complete len:1192 (+) Transcript_12695:18-3593(+)